MTLVSVVIRVRNEETWLSSTLQAITSQNFNDYEVVIVNHGSTDNSVDIAKEFGLNVVDYVPKTGIYRPGEMLNCGIKMCTAKYYALLSAHCVPKNQHWLKEHVEEIELSQLYAGVYGKQLPFMYSPLADKRDLTILFSDEPRDQSIDPFFHNANALIRHDCLYPDMFSETVTNIEDRVWAKQIQSRGLKIRYTAKSPVMHYHGVHQNNSKARLANTIKIYNSLQHKPSNKRSYFMPMFVLSHRCEKQDEFLVQRLMSYSLADISQVSKHIKNLSVTTIVSEDIHSEGFDCSLNSDSLNIKRLDRPDYLNAAWCSILDVLQYTERMISDDVTHLVYLDLHYAFRDYRDIYRALLRVEQEYYANGSTNALVFSHRAKRVIYEDDEYEIHDVLSKAFRPISTGLSKETTMICGGYCSVFDRSCIRDTSLTNDDITVVELGSAISESRILTSGDLDRIRI